MNQTDTLIRLLRTVRMRGDFVIPLRTKNISTGRSIDIVKHGLEDPDIHIETKVLAIQNVIEMATHNSATKDDLVNALRLLYDTYEFE